MEKVLYLLWRAPDETGDEFGGRLRGDLSERLLALGARSESLVFEQ